MIIKGGVLEPFVSKNNEKPSTVRVIFVFYRGLGYPLPSPALSTKLFYGFMGTAELNFSEAVYIYIINHTYFN